MGMCPGQGKGVTVIKKKSPISSREGLLFWHLREQDTPWAWRHHSYTGHVLEQQKEDVPEEEGFGVASEDMGPHRGALSMGTPGSGFSRCIRASGRRSGSGGPENAWFRISVGGTLKALVFGVIKDKRDCGELGDMPVSSGTGIRGEGRDGWQGSCQELTGRAGPWARAKKHGLCGESGVWEGFT